MRIININSSEIIRETGPNLTWVQKLVCRWFKITPEKNGYFDLRVSLDDKSVRPGYVLVHQSGSKWVVYKKDSEYIYIKNLYPLDSGNILGKLTVLYGSYIQGEDGVAPDDWFSVINYK